MSLQEFGKSMELFAVAMFGFDFLDIGKVTKRKESEKIKK